MKNDIFGVCPSGPSVEKDMKTSILGRFRHTDLGRRIHYPVRAEHAFPPSTGSLDAAAELRQLGRILALLGGPREARGRLTAPGALRRRPRFAQQGLASLGLAELRKWLNSVGTNAILSKWRTKLYATC